MVNGLETYPAILNMASHKPDSAYSLGLDGHIQAKTARSGDLAGASGPNPSHIHSA